MLFIYLLKNTIVAITKKYNCPGTPSSFPLVVYLKIAVNLKLLIVFANCRNSAFAGLPVSARTSCRPSPTLKSAQKYLIGCAKQLVSLG
jgi:hypothetical protein